jgi:hypothetical protein
MDIAEARYVEGYKIFIRYPDGAEGIIDFSDHPRDGVFEAWNDINYFRAFRIHPESGVLEWPNEVDIAPEYTYAKVSGVPIEKAWSVMMAYHSPHHASKGTHP